VKYAFITQHKKTYTPPGRLRAPISLQCQVLGVRRQYYYHYRRHTENKPVDPEHQAMLDSVKKIAKASDDTYGSRRRKNTLNCLSYGT
jgi:putative transposase